MDFHVLKFLLLVVFAFPISAVAESFSIDKFSLTLSQTAQEQLQTAIREYGKNQVDFRELKGLNKEGREKLYIIKAKTALKPMDKASALNTLRSSLRDKHTKKLSLSQKELKQLSRKRKLGIALDSIKIDLADIKEQNEKGFKLKFINDSPFYLSKIVLSVGLHDKAISILKQPLAPGEREYVAFHLRQNNTSSLKNAEIIEIYGRDKEAIYLKNPLTAAESAKIKELEKEVKTLGNEKILF